MIVNLENQRIVIRNIFALLSFIQFISRRIKFGIDRSGMYKASKLLRYSRREKIEKNLLNESQRVVDSVKLDIVMPYAILGGELEAAVC